VAGRPSRFLKFTLALLAICVVAYLARGLWLSAIGYGLIHDDGPAKADYAVVLGGDIWGLRIQRGGDMVRQGYVPAVLVSGPPGFYGVNEADLAIDFAVRKGYPREWFIPIRHEGLSTRSEAQIFYPELLRRNAHSFLLVTSNHHSARARRIFLAEAKAFPGAPPFRTVMAPDLYFRPNDWWQNREGQKIAFFEWTKTFATMVGM
jgi:uncharacterized SAM-binding protein YcdF (DUF218 family)